MAYTRILFRRDSAAQWAGINPVLEHGEIGLVIDSIGQEAALFKIGDGVTAWNNLPYASGQPGKDGADGQAGPKGDTPPLSDSVTSPDSNVAASSRAVKTAYDRATEAAGNGLPLLTLVWDTTGLPEPGFLDISLDHGLLSRAEFPEAWAKIERMTAAGSPNVLADSAWLAELAANGGVCGKYSSGDGGANFRAPLIRRRFLRATDAGLPAGTAQGDAIRNITGQLGSYTKAHTLPPESPASALFSTLLDPSGHEATGPWSRYAPTLDASRAVPTAEENRPAAIAYVPLLKVA